MDDSLAFLLILPLVLVQIGVQVFALIDLIKRTRVRGDNKVLWAVVILVGGLIGSLVYIIIGREEG